MTRPASLLLLALACTPPPIQDAETIGSADCDNLDEGQCLFPFPSDEFRADGVIRFRSMPSRAALEPDPVGFSRNDGYSPITPVFFTLAGATTTGTPQWNGIDQSLAATSRTVVIDAETGAFQPHWAEIDIFSTRGREQTPVIVLRLAKRLGFGRRYVVGVHGLVDAEGKVVAPSPGFQPLRDKQPSTRVGVGKRRAHFEENVFPVLAKAGIERADLQLAWDFTTASEKNLTGTLLAMRDAAFAAFGADGPAYTVDAVEENPSGEIARLVRGTAKVPSFLTGTRGTVQHLRLDEAGKPVAQGFEDVEFELQIPNSVWNGTEKGYVVQYGHGLLGTKGQARGGWIRSQAEEQQFLILGLDMQGMSEEDEALWLKALTDQPGELPFLSDKAHQGLVNHLAVVRMLKGAFARETDARFTKNGAPVYDTAAIRYLGNSQGGTMGGVMMSIQPDITRGVLGVPGGAFSFLLSRTALFVDELGALMIALYEDDMRDFVATMGLAQMAFDRIDPINYLHRMTDEPFPNTPSHRVLLSVAREDAQVHNQVTDLVARTVGATLVVPTVRPVWGLTTSPGPVQGNAMSEYDFGLPDYANQLVPLELDHVHGCLRRLPEARLQLDHFWRTGETKNFCPWGDGACFVPQAWNEANCR